MNRTPGSYWVSDFDYWEIKVKVAEGAKVTDHSIRRGGSRAIVEKEYHSLDTDFGRAKFLKNAGITGLLTEVVGLFRHRGLSERIEVRAPKPAKIKG